MRTLVKLALLLRSSSSTASTLRRRARDGAHARRPDADVDRSAGVRRRRRAVRRRQAGRHDLRAEPRRAGVRRRAGTADVAGITGKIAAMLGTAPAEIAITDLAVHPKSGNSFLAVMRGQGANAAAGARSASTARATITVVSLDNVTYTSVAMPNPAAVSTTGRGGRAQSVTDMALSNGRLFVAGLSNEEFASKLWSVAYPFATADRGASVEIYHGNHGQLETRSPVMAFLPYAVNGQPHLIAELHLHAARAVSRVVAEARRESRRHDHRGVRRRQSAARHDRVPEGRQGVPADVELQPRRHEDSDGRLRRRHQGITERVGGTAGIPYETIAVDDRRRAARPARRGPLDRHRQDRTRRPQPLRCRTALRTLEGQGSDREGLIDGHPEIRARIFRRCGGHGRLMTGRRIFVASRSSPLRAVDLHGRMRRAPSLSR